MATIANPDTVGHWCDAARQWIPGRTHITVTAAEAAAASTHIFSTSLTFESITRQQEDGKPTSPTRTHR